MGRFFFVYSGVKRTKQRIQVGYKQNTRTIQACGGPRRDQAITQTYGVHRFNQSPFKQKSEPENNKNRARKKQTCSIAHRIERLQPEIREATVLGGNVRAKARGAMQRGDMPYGGRYARRARGNGRYGDLAGGERRGVWRGDMRAIARREGEGQT